MKMFRSYGLAIVLVCMTLMIASCGKSDDSSTPATVYKVEYVPGTGMNAPTEGKTTFQLMITKTSDGSPATGLTPTLSFLMTMTDGTQHATPIDLVSESSTTPGTYDCTVYYMMSSGATMGTWEMDVTLDNETTKFNPDVAMSMKSDTVRATLKGQNDIISSMSGTEKRSYYIFNDGLTSGMAMGSGTLNLFIAAKESMMSFPALVSTSVSTTTLHDETGASWSADPVTVEASLDTAFTLPYSGTNTKGGHWSISLMSGITSSVTNTIYVRLSVGKNGGTAEQKTTDGNAVSGSNGYQTILVTPSSM